MFISIGESIFLHLVMLKALWGACLRRYDPLMKWVNPTRFCYIKRKKRKQRKKKGKRRKNLPRARAQYWRTQSRRRFDLSSLSLEHSSLFLTPSPLSLSLAMLPSTGPISLLSISYLSPPESLFSLLDAIFFLSLPPLLSISHLAALSWLPLSPRYHLFSLDLYLSHLFLFKVECLSLNWIFSSQ